MSRDLNRLPMAERAGRVTRCEVWVCGRSWVRAPVGAIVRRVFIQPGNW